MSAASNVNRSQKGSVLVMAALLSFGMIVMGLAFLGHVHRITSEIDVLVVGSQSRYAAVAGMMDGLVYRAMFEPGNNYNSRLRDYYKNVQLGYDIHFGGYSGGNYSIEADYTIVGTGAANSYSDVGNTYQISSDIKSTTFADYLYLTDSEHDMVEGNTIYFWTPDTLDGKVHTNDVIHIHPWEDRPVFKKKVTSSASYIDPPNSHARFDEGLYLNQPEIVFPDQAEEVRLYAGDTYTYGTAHPDTVYWLAFLGEGFKLRVSGNRGNSWIQAWDELPLIPLPTTGAIFVNGKCWVSTTQFPDSTNPHDGRLNGRVTVASSDTLYIRGQTLYSCFNDTSNVVPMTCDDALGLISEKWVLVSDRLPSNHYGIKINAGIAALRGSFSIDKIYGNAREHQSLFVYGSIAQFHRGIVHRGGCGSGIGYCQKDYKYDNRFRKHPPPHFIPIDDKRPVYREALHM